MLTLACYIVHSNSGNRCRFLTLCNCTGGLYLQPLSICTLWHMWWSEGCWCWARPTVTCTGALYFFLEQWHIYVLNAYAYIAQLVLWVVVVVVVVVVVCNSQDKITLLLCVYIILCILNNYIIYIRILYVYVQYYIYALANYCVL